MPRRLIRCRRNSKLNLIPSPPPPVDLTQKSSSGNHRNRRSYNGGQQSDPESIKTEEFERHFRGMLIKQVAGVTVRNFDAVTINSDLDSIRSLDVYHKFQEVLKGNRVKGRSTIMLRLFLCQFLSLKSSFSNMALSILVKVKATYDLRSIHIPCFMLCHAVRFLQNCSGVATYFNTRCR